MKDEIKSFVGLVLWVLLFAGLIIGGNHYNKEVTKLRQEIEVMQEEKEEIIRDYEAKIDSLKDKIDELYGELNAHQGVIDQMRYERNTEN